MNAELLKWNGYETQFRYLCYMLLLAFLFLLCTTFNRLAFINIIWNFLTNSNVSP